MAEFKLGRIRFIWKGTWAGSTTYTKDDIVRVGGRTYLCVVGHTSSSSFSTDVTNNPTYWSQVSDGSAWKSSWATTTLYSINDLVIYGGRLYICNTSHTSAATASLGLENDQSKWDVYATSFSFQSDWATSTRYKANDLVRYGGNTYVANTGHTSAATAANGLELNSSYWDVYSKGFNWLGAWANATRYKVNDIVLYGGVSYVCNTGHTSQSTSAVIVTTAASATGGTATLTYAAQVVPPYAVGASITVAGVTPTAFNVTATVVSCSVTQVTYALSGTYGPQTVAGTITGVGQLALEADLAKWDIFHKGIIYLGAWSASSVRYKLNDVVKYGADLWICTTAHTSTAAFATGNWSIWVAGLQFYNSWNSSTTYQPGDLVTYGGYAYVGLTVNTNAIPTSSPSDWTVFTTGFSFQGDWSVSSVAYKVGHVVRVNGYTYVCILDNTSSGSNVPPNVTYWSRLNSGIKWSDTAKTYTAIVGTNVISSGSSATFNITTSGTTYAVTRNANGSGYAVNDTIKILGTQVGGISPANDILITVASVSTGAIATISSTGFAATWATTTAYYPGDTVTVGVNSYVCILSHTSATGNRPDNDTTGTYWNLMASGSINNLLTTQGDMPYMGGAGPTRLPIGTDGQVLRATGTAPTWAYWGQINNVVYVGPTGTDTLAAGSGTTLDKPWKTVQYAAKAVEDGYLNTNAKDLIAKNKQFIIKEISNYVTYTYKVTVTNASATTFTTASTAGIYIGMPITFTGTAGGVTVGTTYYVISTNFTSTTFSIGTTALAGSIVSLNNAGAISNTGNYSFSVSKTERDAGLVVDGLANDISRGGTSFTTTNLLAYYNSAGNAYVTGVIAGDITAFVSALTYMSTLVGNILAQSTPASNYQTLNSVSAGSQALQIKDASLSAENGTSSTVANLITIITAGLTAGNTTSVAAPIYPNTTISVKTGTFSEILPIVIPTYTAIVGDELRGTVVQPVTANSNLSNDKARSIQGLTRIKSQLANLMANTAITPTSGNLQNLATTAASNIAGTATLTFATQTTAPFAVGSTILVAGVTPSGFNGSYTVTACTTTSVSYTNATAGPQTVAGTVNSNVINLGFTGDTGSQAAVNSVVTNAQVINQFIQNGITASITVTAVATGTSVTVNSTDKITAGDSLILSGTAFGTLVASKMYWVASVVDATTITITASQGGTAITFTSASGTMTGITNGGSAFTFTNPTGYNSTYLVGYGDGKAQIVQNYQFFREEIQAFLNGYTTGGFNWSTIGAANQASTLRDIHYLLDSIQYDMTYGGNQASLVNGSAYWSLGTNQIINGYVGATAAALARLKVVIGQVVTKTAVTVSSGNTATQVTTGTAGSAGAATFAQARVQDVIDWSTNGTAPSTVSQAASIALATSALQTAYASLQAARTEIATDAYGWVRKYYQAYNIDATLTIRDAGLVVDALSYDMVLGTNFNTLQAARRYNSVNTSAQAIINNVNSEKTATISAITLIGEKAGAYAASGCTTAVGELINDATTSIIGTITTSLSATTITTNYVTVSSTVGMAAGMTVVFATAAGGLKANRTYWIASVVNSTQLTVSASYNGSAVTLWSTTGLTIATTVNGLLVTHGTTTYNNTLSTIKGAEILRANRTFLAYEADAYIKSLNGGTCQSIASNVITTSSAHNLVAGDPVVFSGTIIGGGNIIAGTKYYVTATSLASTTFTISQQFNGTVLGLTNVASGGTMAVKYAGNSSIITDMLTYIDSLVYDINFTGNYKTRRSVILYNNAVSGSLLSDMFYVRNATGLRNMTTSGLTGSLSTVNAYGTKRPTAGAYTSLDPGFGPYDSNAWIRQRSPYIQNVTTFGTGCVGCKIDGALHQGGNRSIVSNDFTQVLSDGIGVWCTGSNSLTELVSVFSYYGYAGYLAELGGKIRATNGNSSYGTYGTLAEGVDSFESPITATVDNRYYPATVQNVVTDGKDQILRFEYLNAGSNYNTASYSVSGSGYNVVTVADEFRDGAVFQTRNVVSYGSNFVTQTNVCQGGTSLLVTISATDLGAANAYIGMRIQITSGTGAGQSAYFATFSGAKIGYVCKESFSALAVTAAGSSLLTVADTSTLYNNMPIIFTGTLLSGCTLSIGVPYYVVGSSITATQFSVATGSGGSAITVGTASSGGPMTLNALGWDHAVPGTAIASALDLTSAYIIEPRLTFSAPGFTTTARTQTNAAWSDVQYGVTTGSYSSISATGGSGSSASFTVARTGIAYSVVLAVGGSGYKVGDVLTVPGTSLGGTSPANDITINVNNVSSGAVVNWTWTGTGIGGLYLAIPSSGSTTMYSTNGTTWAAAGGTVALASASWTAITYGNGRWVAVANGTATSTTTDALTFTAGTITSGNWTSVCYGNSTFVAVASGTATSASSAAGTAWTYSTLPANSTWTGVAYGAWGGTVSPAVSPTYGIFVAIASGGTVAASSIDGGSTWLARTLPASATWSSVTFGNGRFVAIASGSKTTAYSKDGITWVQSPTGMPVSQAWAHVEYGQGLFFATATGSTNIAATSEDGITWTSRTLTATASWPTVAFGNNNASPLWVALTASSTVANSIVTGVTAKARVKVSAGTISEIRMIEPGSGYTSTPTMVLTDPNQSATSYTSVISGVTFGPGTTGQLTVPSGTYPVGTAIIVTGTNSGAGSIVGYTSGKIYYVVQGGTGVTTITITDSYVNAIASTSALTTVAGSSTGLTFSMNLQARIGNGALGNPTFICRGLQFTTSTASVSGNGYGDDYQTGYYFNVKGLPSNPTSGSNVVLANDPTYYRLVQVTNYLGTLGNAAGANSPYSGRMQVSPILTATSAPEHGTVVTMRIKYSQVRLTGHDFLSIGTGNVTSTNYPGTPLLPVDATKQTVGYGGGRVFYTSTDQDGNFNVGTLFSVQQATGVASINADAFNLAGLNALTLGSVSLGSTSATITSFSTDQYFTANSDNIVPTQKAIKAYVASQIGGGSSALNVNTLTAGVIYIFGNTITTTTGVQILVTATMNFTGGISGMPIAMNMLLN